MDLSEAISVFKKITHFQVTSRSDPSDQKEGKVMVGHGTVVVQTPIGDTLIFEEQGQWHSSSMVFSNKYRWDFNHTENLIRLSHLRYGLNQPEILGEFKPTGQGGFELQCPYLCEKDRYESTLVVDDKSGMIHLSWKVVKPRDSYKLDIIYSLCRKTL